MKNSQKKILLLIIATVLLAIYWIIIGIYLYSTSDIIGFIPRYDIITSFNIIPTILYAFGVFIKNEKEITDEELKKQRTTVIVIAVILFMINIASTLMFNNPNDYWFDFIFPAFLGFNAIISYILFIYAVSLKHKVNVSLISNVKYSNVDKQELLVIKKKQQKYIRRWIIVLIICCLPFTYASLDAIINGVEFIASTAYGFEAIILNFILYSIAYPPIFVINVILLIISIIKIRAYKKSIKEIGELLPE